MEEDELSHMTMTWAVQDSDLLMLAHRVLVGHEWYPQMTHDGRLREYRNMHNNNVITLPVHADDPDADAYLGSAFAAMQHDDVAFHLYELSGAHLGNMIAVFMDDHAIDGTLAAVHHTLVEGVHYTTLVFADRTTQTLPSNRVCMC